MKNNVKTIILGLCVWTMFGLPVYAYNPPSSSNANDNRATAAGCLPSASHTFLDINNVRARINTGGDMWWDHASEAFYEVPKGSNKHSMFVGSLWIGGLDPNGQLKLAAQRYGYYGTDFWPGPLSTDGTASVSPETCIEYDRHFVITRKEVEDFIAWRGKPQLYPDYKVPLSIQEWPAHGNPAHKQARFLAPFFDVDGDGLYNYKKGDYPYYDLDNSLCPLSQSSGSLIQQGTEGPTSKLVDQVLRGDQTLWWVFNDKGNIHSETGGTPMGLEIRAQAFAYATNDEINNMTFYSYEIINRSTQGLTEIYFSQWVDVDLGYAWDDYVGCDVQRGLGYVYNGKAIDGTGKFDHYGENPPAIGLDFFQGPYMDTDGIDNPKYNYEGDSVKIQICDESINGVNFGNGIVDDERLGMRRFVYHNGGGHMAQDDPQNAADYYNLLRGIWKDGTKMLYGANAHALTGAYGPECDFMFPGNSDPCDWGTGGIPPNGPRYWTEEVVGNEPFDRRFMQSTGPFTLEPGAVNYITVGIPWARAATGGPLASVEMLKRADDKCQRLFDNCFRIVEGPDAPDMVLRELDRELILYISNKPNSNNFEEEYTEIDMSIVTPDSVPIDERYDSLYRFEGYQVFQVKDAAVTVDDIHDVSQARLVAQCDVKNGVARLINFYYDENLALVVPVEEVNGKDNGIVHSFRIVEDKFATGDKRLVNNKKYYFLVLAYGYNEYEKFVQAPESQFPGVQSINGQQNSYLAGRKNIMVYTAIPHIPTPHSEGTIMNAEYGSGPRITRIEGHGNGGNILELTNESVTAILANGKIETPTYKNGYGPLNITVVDPLNVKGGNFIVKFNVAENNVDSAAWTFMEVDESDNIIKSWESDKLICFGNEQLILELGLAVNIRQCFFPGDKDNNPFNGMLESSIHFADSTIMWLTGVSDMDGPSSYNWIRSGTTNNPNDQTSNDYDNPSFLDPEENFEKVVGGTWAPYRMASKFEDGPAWVSYVPQNKLENLYSVDVVFTSDKSKWTRCPVIETGEDALLSVDKVQKMYIRKRQSVDKDGNPDGTGTGMGWFPGYAINVETGERLNMMFGEDSWHAGENGDDMKFNPTSNYSTPLGDIIFGGKHFLYVFGSFKSSDQDLSPSYDEGAWACSQLVTATTLSMRMLYQSVMWVSIPMAVDGEEWLSNDARVRLSVTRPYARNYGGAGAWTAASPQNDNCPLYRFSTWDLETTTGNIKIAKSALDLINIVPNPYYLYSLYEATPLDHLVKIVNLPERCTVSIFTVSGTLIRQFAKDDPTTIIEWDLKNQAGIQISGGMYLVHINAPGIGERTVKWFGSLHSQSLNSF